MGDANLKEWLARTHLITTGNCDVKEKMRESIVPDVIQVEGSSPHQKVPGIPVSLLKWPQCYYFLKCERNHAVLI